MQPDGKKCPRVRAPRRGRWCCGPLACGFAAGRSRPRGDAAPAAGELAVFCRPVVTAPGGGAADGTVLADAWLPDLVRLGELERHPRRRGDRGRRGRRDRRGAG